MKRILFLFTLIWMTSLFVYGQDESTQNQQEPTIITAQGEQSTGIGRTEPKLSCQPFLIPEGKIGIISDVDLDGAGFWIGFIGKKPLATFKNVKQAIGYQLMPGQYYIYPSINFNNYGQPKTGATVKISIRLE